MIGLILGTSEGKKILSLLNRFTEDIFVSTATTYGGELLQSFKFKVINTKPLGLEELKNALESNGVKLLVDASHPYASAITENAIEVCKTLGIKYIRYERPSVIEKYKDKVISVKNYEELYDKLSSIEGTILNTTGSRNIEKFAHMNLKNRIVHRVLPSVESMEKCFSLGIRTDDIIAIKGPVGYELNCSFIKEYNAKAIVLKDSGTQGGTEEKLKAAEDTGIKAIVIERSGMNYKEVYKSEEDIVDYIKENFNN